MLIQQTNWITRLRKAAGAKGDAQVELDPNISAFALVSNLDTPEFDFPGGVKQMIVTVSQGAVAAQSSIISLFNPAGSGVLGVLDVLELAHPTAAAIVTISGGFIYVDTGGGLVGAAPQDQRWGSQVTGIATLQVRAGTSAVNPITNLASRFNVLGAQTNFPFQRRIVLPPATGFALVSPVNTAFTADLQWKERPAESGELGLGT